MKINHTPIKQQYGLSLVELMISAVLGLFIIAGLSTVYISSKQTYVLREQTSELDENARTAIRTLREHIEHAGYSSVIGQQVNPYILLPNSAVPTSVNCSGTDKSVLTPNIIKMTANGVGTNSDQIAITYLADNALNTDCTGTALPANCLPPTFDNRSARLVYSSFAVSASDTQKNSLGTSIPSLQCAGSRNATSQPIAQGIENMQILYGVDTTVPTANVRRMWDVDVYWNAAQVTANSAWDKVASVQVALLVRSIEPAFATAQSATYDLLGTTIITNDRYRRAVYNTTIQLRNIAR